MGEHDRDLYYDRAGRPLGLLEWGILHRNDGYRTVAQSTVNGYLVSTVWLGIDHNFAMSGPPVIFETMVFPPRGHAEDYDEYCERYATEEEARHGHDRAVAWARSLLSPLRVVPRDE